MGVEESRLLSPTEESIDAYINRGGARLVNRERKLATSSIVDIGVGRNFTVSLAIRWLHCMNVIAK